jgi:inosine-uridine nucleoside N-ribohydrolase
MSGNRELLAIFVAAIVLSPCGSESRGAADEPVRLIFDTDVGNDVDDALALGVVHALQSRGECRLLAVTVTKDNPYAGPFCDLVNTFYGRGDVPIGTVRAGRTTQDGKFIRQVATATDDGKPRYPHDLEQGDDAPEAVGLLRRVLAGQPDGSVVIVTVGFSTNIARLLDSQPCDASPLSGRKLIAKKVRLLSTMAGAFTEELRKKHFREYNIKVDVPNARKIATEWPTPVVYSGWEIGNAIRYPAASIEQDFAYVEHHPLAHAYRLYGRMPYDRPTYDLTSVLWAVRPQRGYFDLSPRGKVVVEDDGFVRFEEHPDGPHRYLIVDPQQVVRVREALAMLASQPPRR